MHTAEFGAALDNALRDLATIERLAARTRNGRQRPRQIGVAKQVAGRRRVSARHVRRNRVRIGPQQRHRPRPFLRCDFRHGKAAARVLDRGRQRDVERHTSEPVVQCHPSRHRSRDGHRMNAMLRHRRVPLCPERLDGHRRR